MGTMTKSFDESHLLPGRSSGAGFLAESDSFDDIVRQDAENLKSLGITHKQVADRLEYVMGRAKTLLWDIAEDVDDIWKRIARGFMVSGVKVTWTSYLGWQECPWGCEAFKSNGDPYAKSDTDFTMKNKYGSLFASALHVHLIRKHHFFEGHTKYRLDPVECVKVLGLLPGVDYSPSYAERKFWSMSHAHSNNNSVEEYIQEIQTSNSWKAEEDREVWNKGTVVNIPGNNIHARVFGDKLAVISKDWLVLREPVMIAGVPFKEVHNGFSMLNIHSCQFVVKKDGEDEVGGFTEKERCRL